MFWASFYISPWHNELQLVIFHAWIDNLNFYCHSVLSFDLSYFWIIPTGYGLLLIFFSPTTGIRPMKLFRADICVQSLNEGRVSKFGISSFWEREAGRAANIHTFLISLRKSPHVEVSFCPIVSSIEGLFFCLLTADKTIFNTASVNCQTLLGGYKTNPPNHYHSQSTKPCSKMW